jgi:hypothetical protein
MLSNDHSYPTSPNFLSNIYNSGLHKKFVFLYKDGFPMDQYYKAGISEQL